MEPCRTTFAGQIGWWPCATAARPIKQLLLSGAWWWGWETSTPVEALFRAGIRPSTPCSGIGPTAGAQLHAAIREVLAGGGAGWQHLRDFRQRRWPFRGEFQQHAQVYGRGGLPCTVCGTQVRMERQGSAAAFCPRCQRP